VVVTTGQSARLQRTVLIAARRDRDPTARACAGRNDCHRAASSHIGQGTGARVGHGYEGNQWSRFDLVTAGRASTSGDVTAVSRIPNSMEAWWIGADGSVVDSFYYDP